MIKKITLISFFIFAGCLFFQTSLFAIGEFSIGINIGLTYDPNNLKDEITQYNAVMDAYKKANTGSKYTGFYIPYALTAGVNIKYQFNYILFKLAFFYSQDYFGQSTGSLTTAAGVTNNIKFISTQASVPFTIAFIMPIKKRTWFYFGGGLNYYMLSVKITQSNPSGTTGLPNFAEDNFSDSPVGFHTIFGAEFSVYENYTLTCEWMHQFGTGEKVISSTTTNKRAIVAHGDIFMIGINYYVDF